MIDRGLGILLSDHIPLFAREWRNHERIRRWCRQTSLITVDGHRAWLEKIKRDPSIQMYGIMAQKEDDFVGVCGLTSISSTHGTAEFSLYIANEYQNRGYAKRALLTLLGYGFDELGLRNIWGEVLQDNPALKVFEKIGFKQEGFLRSMYFKSGAYYGAHRVSMLSSEWNDKQIRERL